MSIPAVSPTVAQTFLSAFHTAPQRVMIHHRSRMRPKFAAHPNSRSAKRKTGERKIDKEIWAAILLRVILGVLAKDLESL